MNWFSAVPKDPQAVEAASTTRPTNEATLAVQPTPGATARSPNEAITA